MIIESHPNVGLHFLQIKAAAKAPETISVSKTFEKRVKGLSSGGVVWERDNQCHK